MGLNFNFKENPVLECGWPSSELGTEEIFESGCHLALAGRGKRVREPVEREEYLANPGEVTSTHRKEAGETHMDESEWRITFSLAEN